MPSRTSTATTASPVSYTPSQVQSYACAKSYWQHLSACGYTRIHYPSSEVSECGDGGGHCAVPAGTPQSRVVGHGNHHLPAGHPLLCHPHTPRRSVRGQIPEYRAWMYFTLIHGEVVSQYWIIGKPQNLHDYILSNLCSAYRRHLTC